MSRIYALFWRTFFRPKKYVGVPKMTIMRYGQVVQTFLVGILLVGSLSEFFSGIFLVGFFVGFFWWELMIILEGKAYKMRVDMFTWCSQ